MDAPTDVEKVPANIIDLSDEKHVAHRELPMNLNFYIYDQPNFNKNQGGIDQGKNFGSNKGESQTGSEGGYYTYIKGKQASTTVDHTKDRASLRYSRKGERGGKSKWSRPFRLARVVQEV